MQFAQATEHEGAWSLEQNPIWNVPPSGDVHFDHVTEGSMNRLVAVKALVFEYKTGRIFGIRKARELKEDSYVLRGRVSIGNKKHPCFTGKRTFRRPDGSLCDVAVLFV